MNVKINISFDHRSLLAVPVTRVVRQCILATLQEEKVPVPCEINVLLTDDGGIHAINLATRQVDRPTDVLSFPMFQLTPGRLPRDWSNYLDPETGLCPLGDMAISLERAKAQAAEFGHSVRREVGYLTIHSMRICWATTTWTRDLRRPKCAPTRRPSSAPLIYIDKNK